MKLRNRLHTLTRWPSDPRRRLELAETDIWFADAISKIVCEDVPEIKQIALRAFRMKCQAQHEKEC